MRIQFIKVVTSPREARGGMHDLRDVPEHIGRPLIDGGYAVFIPDTPLVVSPAPQPVNRPEPAPAPEAQAVKPKTKSTKKSRRKP